MHEIEFDTAFDVLTGNKPFPWQRALYGEFVAGRFPPSCTLPTGLGKTNVIAVWLLALAANPAKVPRRLVYVVNRRTVVDQSTRVAEDMRARLLGAMRGPPWAPELIDLAAALGKLCALPTEVPLAISTLRGQFADNREWTADPARPAVVVGTVDMVGSRLLFSGYGCGFKTRPLHAGFLGQDALLVHDEAHLEQPFQQLIEAIRDEQERCRDFGRLRVMALTATPRGGGDTFTLTDADRANDVVKARTAAVKTLHLEPLKDEKKLAEQVADLAVGFKDTGRAVLAFVRRVDDVQKVADRLGRVAPGRVERLTGTLRGLERDRLATENRVFARFLPAPDRRCPAAEGTVYLVCSSAGEVGVNLSADDLVCDLTPFESMAQRFGRVNRFGDRPDTAVRVVHPTAFDTKDEYAIRCGRTLALLGELGGDAGPAALGRLRDRTDRAFTVDDAFSLPPVCVPTSDILFDAWALTTVRGKLPGRPPVADYLHGVSAWEPPETHVAWRHEVAELNPRYESAEDRKAREPAERKRLAKFAATLLGEYPLKPHELLRDRTDRVFDQLKKLKAPPDTPAWLVDDDDAVEVTTLGEVVEAGKDPLARLTVLLPPVAGGLRGGILAGDEGHDPGRDDYDVADNLLDAAGNPRRVRRWSDDRPAGLRLIRKIDLGGGEDEDAAGRVWYWYESPRGGDGDGSRSNKKAVAWQVHTDDVTGNTKAIVAALPLPEAMRRAVIRAAEWHDLGKLRSLFQRVLGNTDPGRPLAKSGGGGGRRAVLDETYRHEFGSLLDAAGQGGFDTLGEYEDLVLHLIAAHHGRGRPHFPADEAFDPERPTADADRASAAVPRRFAGLQRKYGRWGLAYLESLLRAADYAASASPSAEVEGDA